jgi:hypothetical protein
MEVLMENIIGPPVKGNNLKFRDRDITEIIIRLSTGSVMLIGLRRIGKSSVMLGTLEQLPDSWIKSHHDLQGMQNPVDFFFVLLKSLPQGQESKLFDYWQKTKNVPDRLLKYIKKNFTKLGGVEFADDIINYWNPLTEGIEQIIKESPSPILIILDEFPYLLENMIKSGIKPNMIEKMLAQLRAWRNKYQNFHLFIGGSISLDHFLSRNNISASTITDFSRYFLPPFTKDEARLFLKELSASSSLSWYNDNLIEESLTLIEDYYPFFLQSLFMSVKFHGGQKGMSLIDIYDNYFIPSIEKTFFRTFIDRLNNHYSKNQQKMVKAILTCISNQPNLIANYSQIRDEVSTLTIKGEVIELNTILYDLVSDEFLSFRSRTNEYSFVAKIVAKWWKVTWGRK